MHHPHPVIIISGFLGSGKTTLLNEIIRQHPDVPLYLIENEFGDLNVDGAMVDSSLRDKIELSGGCICCTLDSGFREALLEIGNKMQANGYVLIETTGLADPSQIKKAILTDPVLQSNFSLQSLITLADAGTIQRWLEADSGVKALAAKQLSAADLIVLSHCDQLSDSEISAIQTQVQQWQPLASIVHARFGKTDCDILTWSAPVLSQSGFKYHPSGALPNADVFMESCSLSYTQPFQLLALIHRMNVLIKIQGKDIYRMKGWIYAEDEDSRFIIQSAGDAFLITKGAEWQSGEVKNSGIVFIGKDLNADILDRNLKACLSK
jgi:G3E family GTPase